MPRNRRKLLSAILAASLLTLPYSVKAAAPTVRVETVAFGVYIYANFDNSAPVKSITLPNGNVVTGVKEAYGEVNNYGSYRVYATGEDDKKTEVPVNITNTNGYLTGLDFDGDQKYDVEFAVRPTSTYADVNVRTILKDKIYVSCDTRIVSQTNGGSTNGSQISWQIGSTPKTIRIKQDGYVIMTISDTYNHSKDVPLSFVFDTHEVNKDTNGDGVPDINIDNNRDGVADTNIDDDGDGKPDRNFGKYDPIPLPSNKPDTSSSSSSSGDESSSSSSSTSSEDTSSANMIIDPWAGVTTGKTNKQSNSRNTSSTSTPATPRIPYDPAQDQSSSSSSEESSSDAEGSSSGDENTAGEDPNAVEDPAASLPPEGITYEETDDALNITCATSSTPISSYRIINALTNDKSVFIATYSPDAKMTIGDVASVPEEYKDLANEQLYKVVEFLGARETATADEISNMILEAAFGVLDSGIAVDPTSEVTLEGNNTQSKGNPFTGI